MTVCVAIKVHDCIVFAADSASSLIATAGDGRSAVQNVWEHGLKVFNLHRDLPIVAMTAGLGHFGPASISNLAKDLRLHLAGDESGALNKNTYTIEEVANAARDFFTSKYNEIEPPLANPHLFEFWIGGYGANGARGEIWKLEIENGTPHPVMQLAKAEDDSRVVWGGQSTAINRLLIGFDHQVNIELVEKGLSEQDISDLKNKCSTPLVHSSMPVQDAINLADFLVDITKRYISFLPLANVVGGDTDIATVTKYESFKWIKRKHYYPEHLNRRDTDHVAS